MRPITQPQGLALQDWADQVTVDLRGEGYIGQLSPDQPWQEWAAAQVVGLPSLRGLVPDPYQFATWLEWAERLCGAIN